MNKYRRKILFLFEFFVFIVHTVEMTENRIYVRKNLEQVCNRMAQAMKNRPEHLNRTTPTLVAVSKTKPVKLIIEAYQVGQRHFGENYLQELISKATDDQVLCNCPEIKWHFIGRLQSNKVSKIVSLPNLYVVESVDSKKLATQLERRLVNSALQSKLKVYVQINTSLEKDKNGVPPNETNSLVKHIMYECPHLSFAGLMTIGKYGYDLAQGPNPDFLTLVECKKHLCEELGLSSVDVQLSMGMSSDFEQAIELGSTSVRIGSMIFGSRERKI